jgi:bacteriorhodopsin
MKELVKDSIDYSLGVQGFTMLANLYGLSIPLEGIHTILREVLLLETGVQGIELVFYLWYRGMTHAKDSSPDITRFRYYDWILTTPIMLISTIGFYVYLKHIEEGKTESINFTNILLEHKGRILLIVVFNALMLAFGYLQEIGSIDIWTSSFLGYLALCGSFYTMYDGFVRHVSQKGLFYFMFVVWSFYGLAAMAPSAPKNIAYNALDIFAKNFYGIYLTYTILSLPAQS